MGLERDEGEQPAQDPEGKGGIRAEMTPARQERYDSVLAELESGADQDPDSTRARKATPKKGGGATTRSAAPSPARRYGDDRDAPDADDEDMELLPEEDGLVEGTLDPPKAKKPAPRPAPKVVQDDDEDDDDEADDDSDEADDDTDVEADDEDGDEPADEDEDDDLAPSADDDDEARAAKTRLSRGLRQLAQREARDKAAARARDAAYETQRAEFIAEWQPRVAKVREFEALMGRAERDPIGTILEFAQKVAKLDGDNWAHVSKQMFLRSPAALKDPRSAAEAAVAQRELESTSAVRRLEDQIAKLSQTLEARDQAADDVRATRNYLKRAIAMAGDETPLLRRMAKKDAAGLTDELHVLAARLAEKNGGRSVHPRKLIRAWERREAKRLERLGVKTKKKAATDAAETKPRAGKTKAARPGANGAGKPLDRKALHADVLAGLEALPSSGRAARA